MKQGPKYAKICRHWKRSDLASDNWRRSAGIHFRDPAEEDGTLYRKSNGKRRRKANKWLAISLHHDQIARRLFNKLYDQIGACPDEWEDGTPAALFLA